MSQNKEASQFLSRIGSLPKGPVSLDGVLQPSLDDEAELRKLFATDKANPRLKDIHVGLVDVFAAPSDIRTTRARVIKDDADKDAEHVMVLPSSLRREEGSPAMVENIEAFKKNWSVFTENSLSQLADWSNVIAAGGSVQACLMPLPKAATGSKRAMRKYYHDKAFPSSDVDLFLYGLTVEEAERKVITLYEAVRDSVPWDVTCVRTKHTVSIYSQYPYRSVQIVLRLYSSPAEILAGFDVDAPCCAYDGDRVWANPRAIVSMMRQSNTVDMTRRSPSYEVRLAKYSSRGFEVYVPGLKRDEVDPTIYERSVGRVQGLARLLAIEKLATPEARSQYQVRRSLLRGRPTLNSRPHIRGGRRYHGDLKADTAFSGLEMSDYDIVNLHIPYGPGWDARRIERLIFKTDFGANSPYNPKNKNRRLHRHSAFFGTAEECIEDCCELCPEPKNEEEHKLQDEEDKSYVRGRIVFIEEDPGRQSISGSFNPIDDGEWSETAYVQATAKFFSAISMNDVLAVKQMIEDGEDLNRRDQVGRTPLHVAIMSNSVEVGCALIDAGARMTARLVGGRTSLHLAAQMEQATLVKKMLERSAYNKDQAEEEKRKMEEAAAAKDTVRMSSEDDWSSDESDDDEKPHRKPPTYVKQHEPEKDSDPLEDNEEEPDIIDISIHDWDFGLTSLSYAILSGSLEAVDALLAAGADPTFVAHAKNVNPLHPLTLTMFTQDEERAVKIAERLIAAQAISSTADDLLFTIFHRIVASGKTKIVSSLLEHDPNAKKVINSPTYYMNGLVFPVVSTITAGDYATLSLLLAHGAKLSYSPEDVSRAEEKLTGYLYAVADYRSRVFLPTEAALSQCDEVISLLAALGAEVDVPIKSSNNIRPRPMSLLQWTSNAISFLESKTVSEATQAPDDLPDAPAGDSWSEYRAYLTAVFPHSEVEYIGSPISRRLSSVPRNFLPTLETGYAQLAINYLKFAESTLRNHGATFLEEAPTSEQPAPVISQRSGYLRYGKYTTTAVPVHLKVFYDELYDACWKGDNATIQELCLPKQVEEGKEPIQIVVQTTTAINAVAPVGWTPFLVALHRRHWDTARLVLSIAKAQYQPDTEIVVTTNPIIHDDSDSDEEGQHDSGEDDYSDYDEPINFIDIAARPSSVRTEVPPIRMLELQATLLQEGRKYIKCTPLQKAILEDDSEAFVHTLDLCDFAGQIILPDSGAHHLAVALDRPEMLDELIRRSGVGIPIPSDAEKGSGAQSKASDERVYLGLKVGGKRAAVGTHKHRALRKVLKHTHNYELLRSAIRFGATKVIDYLAGPRPAAAFTHYAETHNDDVAQYLKSIDNLGAVFPELLGWPSDELNESPLLCAVIIDQLDVLKQMFTLKPSLMEEALDLRVRFVGFNPLLAAAYHCSGAELVDFLLEKGCDPSERDIRGWNIYHLVCITPNIKRVKFMEHLLKTLPEDLTHELLAQTSKEAFNTPLMLAVKRGNVTTTRTILEFGIDPAVFLLRDADGSTPLHAAVQKEDLVLAELLLKYGPTELLYTENSVGQTPLDIASLKGIPRLTGPGLPRPSNLPVYPEQLRNPKMAPPFHVEKQKVEIPKLRATIDALLAEGRLAHGTKLTTELLAFADRMEGRLAEEVARESAEKNEAEDGEPDRYILPGSNARMYFALRDAAASRPGRRQLVHLADVQRSVRRNLERKPDGVCLRTSQLSRAVEEEDKEADPEEKRIAELKARSLFGWGTPIFDPKHVDLYGEDKF